MNETKAQSMFQCIARLNRIVLLDLLRRKDLFVVFTMVGIFIFFVLVFRMVGIDNDATATFLLNLGLTLSFYTSHVLVLLLACRQMPDEIDNRTVFPLLAKPIQRGWLVLSRILTLAACGWGVWFLLSFLCWISVPKREYFDPLMLGQMFVMSLISIAASVSMAVFLSLVLNRLLAVVALFSIFFLSGKVLKGLETIEVPDAWEWLFAYVPDYSRLNLVTRYTDGMSPLNGLEFLWATAYGLVIGLTGAAAAIAVFNRKSL